MLRLYLHNHDPSNRTQDFCSTDIEKVCDLSKSVKIQLDFDDAWRVDENIFATLCKHGVNVQINAVTAFSQYSRFPISYFPNCSSEIVPEEKFFSFNDLFRLQSLYAIKVAFHSRQHERVSSQNFNSLIKDYRYFQTLCDTYNIKSENEIVLPYGAPPKFIECLAYRQFRGKLIGTESNYRYLFHRLLFKISQRTHVCHL